MSDWYDESSKTGTLHVGGLAGKLEQPHELTKRFGKYGTVVGVTVRTRREDGKVSWALVSFKEDDATENALGDESRMVADGLVVKAFDMTKRVESTGALGLILMEHRQKLKRKHHLSPIIVKLKKGDSAKHEAGLLNVRSRASSSSSARPMTVSTYGVAASPARSRAVRRKGSSDEVYAMAFDDVTDKFRYTASKWWSRDRWDNLEVKPFCFTGHDAVEWLKRWLFENDLPHGRHDAVHVATRLMEDGVYQPLPSGRPGALQRINSNTVRDEDLYQLVAEREEESEEQDGEKDEEPSLLPPGDSDGAGDGKEHINCVGKHGLPARETAVAGYNCDSCGAEDFPASTRIYGCKVCDYDVCQKCWDLVQAPSATMAGRGRMSVTLGHVDEPITPDTRGIYVIGTCGSIHRGKMGEKLWFDTTGTPSGDVVVVRQEIGKGQLESTTAKGEITLRPNHGQASWEVTTEMRMSSPGDLTSAKTITVTLAWELIEGAVDPDESAEEIDPEAEASAAVSSLQCIDEITPSDGHPRVHPDDDSLNAIPSEAKYVGYRTVRFENKEGQCVAELHLVLTFESMPTLNDPKKLDEHCPYEYFLRGIHTAHSPSICHCVWSIL